MRNLEDLCIKGTLAPELGNLSHMISIILRNNSFYGTIPKEIISLKELEVLDLDHNYFTVPIPLELVNNLSLVPFLLDNKLMLSKNLVDEIQLSSAIATAAFHDKKFPQNIVQPVDIVPQSRRLLQAPKPSKIDAKEDNKKASASSPVVSPAPSHSPQKSPQGTQPRPTNKPKAKLQLQNDHGHLLLRLHHLHPRKLIHRHMLPQ